MDKTKKKNIKRIIALAAMAAVVILLAAMPLIARQAPGADGPQASILSGTVQTGSVDRKLTGGGTLAEETAVSVSVPAQVLLTDFLVANGDTVAQGDAIASVDRVSVMNAIAQVQESLEYLAKQIETESAKETDGQVNALAGGTVKTIFAQAGDSVQDVMLTYGALAILSLDGRMAVDVTNETTYTAGTAVTVTLSDGTSVAGKVETGLAGEMTVCISDEGYAIGDTAQVFTEDGTQIGSGVLYVYSPWNATAYAGTVSSVSVAEGDSIVSGDVLMELTDVGYTATYQQLIGQRQEYEALMQELMTLYQTLVVTAPRDGVVSGVDAASAQLLANAQPEEETESAAISGNSYPTGSDSWGSMGSYPQNGQTTTVTLYDLSVAEIAAVTPQDTITVDITVDEQDIMALKTGMDAQVKINALGGEKFPATVTDISNTGTNNGGSSKYTVQLTLERGADMLSGMNATATIILETTQEVLTIPAAALVEQGLETVVYTGYNADKEQLLDPVTVTVGVSDGNTVQILSGLSDGMTYYYAYYDTLEISFTPDFGGGGMLFGR